MALPDGLFGIDYARYPQRNDSFARISRPELVALQDYRKRLTTEPRMLFWLRPLIATGRMPSINLANLVLSSGVTPDSIRDTVREVLHQSPFTRRADVVVTSMAPDVNMIAVVHLISGQKLRLNIETSPFSITSEDVPPA